MSQEEARENTAEPSFDLSAFEAADVGVLEVQTPAGGPLLHQGRPVRIHLYGPGSAEYTRAQARADAAAQARTFAAIRGKAAKNATEEQREDAINKLVACTQRVENFPIPGGADALYRNARLGYITNQVGRFLEDWGNFLPPSAQS